MRCNRLYSPYIEYMLKFEVNIKLTKNFSIRDLILSAFQVTISMFYIFLCFTPMFLSNRSSAYTPAVYLIPAPYYRDTLKNDVFHDIFSR